ncbi:hypothetical protein DM860_015337 [Cuscuta australis]|uniref:Uncharacterized protein n=1 Tax=Cuscuta australis TaxID=267555 RepID=A0A328DL84_9ASTE|nr:hypothetical protein DM860_015337 [Cuscuta australis]
MTKQFGLRLLIPSVYHSSPLPATAAASLCLSSFYAHRTSRKAVLVKRRGCCCSGYKTSRRLSFGVGLFMAADLGGKSFLASSSAQKKGSIEQVLKNVNWTKQFPFKRADFERFDESKDSLFYEIPRFVTHIDDPAIAALTRYYSESLPPTNTPGVAILDMCSSWVSHYPAGYKQNKIVGLGMNEEELKLNPVLSEYVVQDYKVAVFYPVIVKSPHIDRIILLKKQIQTRQLAIHIS